jgi:hypothetical protein
LRYFVAFLVTRILADDAKLQDTDLRGFFALGVRDLFFAQAVFLFETAKLRKFF